MSEGPVRQAAHKKPICQPHCDSMLPSLRAHFPDHPPDQLDPLVRSKDPGLAHPVVLVDREGPLSFDDFDHSVILRELRLLQAT